MPEAGVDEPLDASPDELLEVPREPASSPVESLADVAAESDVDSSRFAFVGAFDEVLRSFFAQPVPLKWIVGVAKPLTIVPSAPHSGQKRGP